MQKAAVMNTSPMTSLQRANRGEEKLWKIWWQWGIPLGMAANVLTVLAEVSREADYPATGDALDILKLLLYVGWFRLAWRCSKNTDHPVWTNLARLAIFLGFGVAAVTI
jgi:hypothetical protein